jgi:dihydropteridine reductase
MHIGKNKVSNVFCAAGGWKGGSIRDSDFLESYAENTTVNLEPALLASYFGVQHLEKNGLLVLTGAAAAMQPQPNMLAYGMCKATTHYLLQSISQDDELVKAKRNITAIAVLPEVIDTVANRFSMPNADTSAWTKPEDIASEYAKWLLDPTSRPLSGSLMLVRRENGATSWSSV